MKKPSLKYVGDKRILGLLDQYECPVPFHAVRTRLLGNIATPRLDASPVQTIKDLWGGEFPPVDSMDDLNSLLQDLMSLWNSLVRHQSRTRPFKLARASLGISSEDLQIFCQTRAEEFEGFLDGLLGDEETLDLPERAVQGMDELEQINAMICGVLNLLETETDPGPDSELAGLRKNVSEISIIAEKEIHAVILACKTARAPSMPWDDEPPPTLH